jgi:hypothetical protein
VIAFRGTRPPLQPKDDASWATFLDWMNNADSLSTANRNYPGAVHRGFARSADRLWDSEGSSPGIEAHVEALLVAGAPRRLYVTGHSKGGALANLAAWRARGRWPDIVPRVVTFAAARAGDEAFKAAYEQAGIRCTRYEVRADLVPLLPPGPDLPPMLREFLDRLPGIEIGDLDYAGVASACWAGARSGKTCCTGSAPSCMAGGSTR